VYEGVMSAKPTHHHVLGRDVVDMEPSNLSQDALWTPLQLNHLRRGAEDIFLEVRIALESCVHMGRCISTVTDLESDGPPTGPSLGY
jgi:hypothetical protein